MSELFHICGPLSKSGAGCREQYTQRDVDCPAGWSSCTYVDENGVPEGWACEAPADTTMGTCENCFLNEYNDDNVIRGCMYGGCETYSMCSMSLYEPYCALNRNELAIKLANTQKQLDC